MPDTSDLIEDEFLSRGPEFVNDLVALDPEFWPRHIQRNSVPDAIASAFNGLPLDKQRAIALSVLRLLGDGALHESDTGRRGSPVTSA